MDTARFRVASGDRRVVSRIAPDGALGLILPVVTGIAPFLVRVAAACLATLMGGAVATHAMRREPAAVPTVLALLAIVVATWR